MTEASADQDQTGLEQRILQMLRDSDSPVKAARLAKDLNVPKKTVNQILYRMEKESRVTLADSAMWCLAKGGTQDVIPTAPPTPPNQAQRLQHSTLEILERPGPPLSELQENIYKFLKTKGPHKALHIAQALGMKTAKEVNPDLHALKAKHILDLDPRSHSWMIYQPEVSGGKNQSATIIYQQNPINLINQSGPNSNISIQKAEDIQIGHGNIMVRQTACGGSDVAVPLQLPQTHGTPLGALGPQDIHMDRSVLKRVQLGHANEMSIHNTPTQGSVNIPSGPGSEAAEPRGSATAVGPEASFKLHMPQEEPCPGEDVTQRVHITSCFLEDSAIGNHNRMTIIAGGADKPRDSREDTVKQEENTGPGSEVAQASSKFPQQEGQATSSDNLCTFTSHLEAMTLLSRISDAAGDGY